MINLKHITDEQLLKDWLENEHDLEVCRTVVTMGIHYYASGEPIIKYIGIGEEIKLIIENEMEERNINKPLPSG